MERIKDKFLGCIYGLAIGDALGYQVEFMKLSEIKGNFGQKGITDLGQLIKMLHHSSNKYPVGIYSDDTQMSLATAKALIKANSDNVEDIMYHIRQEYIHWFNSPDNNRAPGNTCLRGIENLKSGINWKNSGDKYSKSCGAAMRTAPIGLYFYDNLSKLEEIAYASSICTHAHPTGITAGIGTAYLTSLAVIKEFPEKIIKKLIKIGKKYDISFTSKIENITKIIVYSDSEKAIKELGEGWNGEETVAIALYCFLKNPKDYKKTVLMAANTNGDSDSIACIAGAISGAYNGVTAIPRKWIKQIEDSELLKETGEELFNRKFDSGF